MIPVATLAHAADVDWKVYGFASVAGPEVCFYEALSVTRAPNGLERVWTKCLGQKDIEAVDLQSDVGRKIIGNAAQKMRRPYVPPISIAEDIDFDQATIISFYEEAANLSGIKPHSTIFYELNCSQRMMRELSMTFDVNGKYGSSNKPSDWKFVPPEGNGASLLKILCRAQ
jgi:hypothetical protein